jgi:hypothetical protein
MKKFPSRLKGIFGKIFNWIICFNPLFLL